MSPKLIYLHIPKTGGSSQRFTLYDLYREKNVFWFGIDDAETPVTAFSAQILGSYPVIGGHKPIGFYPAQLEALYFAMIREPIERVCSLFTHITKPELRAGEKGQARKHAHWLEQGMDPDSLVNSLANCRDFRAQVSNYQCHFLSRYRANFADTCTTMSQAPCVVGTLELGPALNRRLGELLQWMDLPEKRLNRGLPDSLAQVLQEPGARAAIEELNREDIKLYNHVRDTHSGLYCNIPDPARFANSLSSKQFPPGISAAESSLRSLSVYSKGYTGLRDNGRGSTSIVITNTGAANIDSSTFPGLSLRYEVLDSAGGVLHSHLTPEPLEPGIAAGGQLLTHLEFRVPTPQIEQAAMLRVEVMVNPGKPVSELNPLHAAVVTLIRVHDH